VLQVAVAAGSAIRNPTVHLDTAALDVRISTIAEGSLICQTSTPKWLGRAWSMSAKGLRVFVIEDEPMIRMLVMDMLEELGCRLAPEVGDVEEAAKLVQSTDFDLAIST
jgi:hypothetical protein